MPEITKSELTRKHIEFHTKLRNTGVISSLFPVPPTYEAFENQLTYTLDYIEKSLADILMNENNSHSAKANALRKVGDQYKLCSEALDKLRIEKPPFQEEEN